MLPPPRHRRVLGAVVVIVLVSLAFVSFACRERSSPPVVLIGVDGLEWRVALDLVREGRMPVLARLMEKGTFGYLKTVKQTQSPVIWTTVATGKGSRKHGIHGFIKGGSGPARLFSNRDRKTKALWNIFSDAGRTVASHDADEWLESRPQQMLGAEAETERLEQLRALGYIE